MVFFPIVDSPKVRGQAGSPLEDLLGETPEEGDGGIMAAVSFVAEEVASSPSLNLSGIRKVVEKEVGWCRLCQCHVYQTPTPFYVPNIDT